MSERTDQDRRNAAVRREIADRQNAAYQEAQQLALGNLGPGWMPWMKLVLLDADHRRTGNITPVATVYKVYRGQERLTERSMFLRRMPDGHVEQAESYEPLFGDLLTEKHSTRTIEVRGQQVPVGKYELCWSSLEMYHPRSAESLAEGRERRVEKAVEREAASSPLFADQIREDAAEEKLRGRG